MRPLEKIAALISLTLGFGLFGIQSAVAQQHINMDRPHEYNFVQVQLGASFFDPDDSEPVLRGSLGAQVGRRFGEFGVFLNLDFDRTLHGTHEARHIRYTQFGPGVEYLTPSGFLRSSLSGGLSVLNSDYKGDTAGKRGWYAELRPIAIRWSLPNEHIFELSPIAFEVTRPLSDDSVTIFDHYVKVSYEW